MLNHINVEHVADELVRHYTQISGQVPSFSEYLKAREHAVKELSLGLYEEAEEHLPHIEKPVKPQAPKQAAAHRPAAKLATPPTEEEEIETSTAPKSDFEILRQLEDEWN